MNRFHLRPTARTHSLPEDVAGGLGNLNIRRGSVFRFFPCVLVEYSRNVSLPEYQKLKPNELLVWRAIEWACENSFPRFSMGANHRFLREFGGSTEPINRYRLDRTFLRRHDTKESAVELAGELVRKMPAGLEPRIRKLLGREKEAGW